MFLQVIFVGVMIVTHVISKTSSNCVSVIIVTHVISKTSRNCASVMICSKTTIVTCVGVMILQYCKSCSHRCGGGTSCSHYHSATTVPVSQLSRGLTSSSGLGSATPNYLQLLHEGTVCTL